MILVGAYAKSEKSYGEIGKTLPWFMDPANLFIIIGSIVFTLAFLGCIGALRENICILRTVCNICVCYTFYNDLYNKRFQIGIILHHLFFFSQFEYTIDVLLLLEVALAIYVYVDRKRVSLHSQQLLMLKVLLICASLKYL